MEADYKVGQGDTKTLTETLLDAVGVAIDLTGATVEFRFRIVDDTAPAIVKAATVVTPLEGKVSVALLPADLATPGEYDVSWWITPSGGARYTWNANRFLRLHVHPQA